MGASMGAKIFFNSLAKDAIHLVDEFYDENAVFVDPMVELNGRGRIKTYYANLYGHVQSILWDFPTEIQSADQTALAWVMTLRARNFNRNQPLQLNGVSVIRFGGPEGKAIYHRDYFDMGAFVYEGLPVLGGVIRFVKGKMAAHQGDHPNG